MGGRLMPFEGAAFLSWCPVTYNIRTNFIFTIKIG